MRLFTTLTDFVKHAKDSLLAYLKRTNKWKIAFFSFVLFLIVSIGSLFSLVTRPIPTSSLPSQKQVIAPKKIETTLVMNKAEVQTLFNALLDSDNYQLTLEQDIRLKGKTNVLGFTVDFLVIGMPYATQEGNIELRITQIQAGALKLPVSLLLNAIRYNTDLPNWLVINGQNKTIRILLATREWEQGVTVFTKAFDLEKDTFIFDIGVPNETIWQLINQREGQ